MHLSNERMLVILAVGALVGDWLLPRFNFHIWSGLTGMIIESAIGATVLLVILRSVGASGWGGGR